MKDKRYEGARRHSADERRPVFDATLAVVPSDPLEAYEAKGRGLLLRNYYNPLGAFARVYCLSPLESVERERHGMHVIPTEPRDLATRLADLHVDIARAYGGYWACTYLCAPPDVVVPRVVSVHDTNPDLLHDEVKNADVVFTVSGAVRSFVQSRGVAPERVRMLPNRVDLDVFRPSGRRPPVPFASLRAAGARHVILHVGRKAHQKNIDTLVRALAVLDDSYAAAFVGPGDADPYEALAASLGISNRCAFLGAVPNDALPAYYETATCVCLPSRWEGFGIVFVEALACGAVVVASDIAPLNEFMRHDRDALLVRNHEAPGELAAAIRQACLDTPLRERLSREAPTAATPFAQGGIDALEVGLYAEVLGAARAPVMAR